MFRDKGAKRMEVRFAKRFTQVTPLAGCYSWRRCFIFVFFCVQGLVLFRNKNLRKLRLHMQEDFDSIIGNSTV